MSSTASADFNSQYIKDMIVDGNESTCLSLTDEKNYNYTSLKKIDDKKDRRSYSTVSNKIQIVRARAKVLLFDLVSYESNEGSREYKLVEIIKNSLPGIKGFEI